MEVKDEDIKKALEQHIRIANYVDSSYCDSVSVDLLQETIDFINRQQAEIERLQRNLSQCENGYSQELQLARCKIEELKSLCTSEDKLIKELRSEIERLQKKYDKAMDNLKAVLKERAGEQ